MIDWMRKYVFFVDSLQNFIESCSWFKNKEKQWWKIPFYRPVWPFLIVQHHQYFTSKSVSPSANSWESCFSRVPYLAMVLLTLRLLFSLLHPTTSISYMSTSRCNAPICSQHHPISLWLLKLCDDLPPVSQSRMVNVAQIRGLQLML